MIKPHYSLKLYQKGINFSSTPYNYSHNIYYQNQYLDNGPITSNYYSNNKKKIEYL